MGASLGADKMLMAVRYFLVAVLCLGAGWDYFTTLYGVAAYFDLPLNPGINPMQFTFAMVLTGLVFSLVIGSSLIWAMKSDDIAIAILRAACALCIGVNMITSWQGTKYYVFYGDDGDAARGIGLALASLLTVLATVFLPRVVQEVSSS
jgi:hypothetical protein